MTQWMDRTRSGLVTKKFLRKTEKRSEDSVDQSDWTRIYPVVIWLEDQSTREFKFKQKTEINSEDSMDHEEKSRKEVKVRRRKLRKEVRNRWIGDIILESEVIWQLISLPLILVKIMEHDKYSPKIQWYNGRYVMEHRQSDNPRWGSNDLNSNKTNC